MQEYAVSGQFPVRDGSQPFTKRVSAKNENVARERVYAELGSEHGLERFRIELDDPEVVDT